MQIKDIVSLSGQMTNPVSNVSYHLYSLPSFDDNQTREEVSGTEIQSGKFIVPNKCILFNKLNVRFKRVWIIDNLDSNKVCSTEFLPLVVDESKVDFYYCYYLLISDSITNYLTKQKSNTSGSHKRIDPTDFLNINISLPPLSEQKKVGLFLHSLDRKISLNRSINKELEQMAKEIYDYWFVQFDFPDENGRPYKSSGGAMVYNPILKREIPKGWEVLQYKEILDRYKSTKKIESKDYLSKGETPIIDQGPNYIVGYTDEYEAELDRFPATLFGDHSLCVKYLRFPFARGADGTQILYSKNKCIKPDYLFLSVKSLNIPNPGYSRHFKYLKEMHILQPDLSIAERFESYVDPIFELWSKIILQNINIDSVQSTLLPLLMTGQVKIKE